MLTFCPAAIPQYESQNESSDDADVIPGRGANPITKKAGLLMDDALDQDDQDEEEDDNDDDEGDEYAVEKIISHDFDDGVSLEPTHPPYLPRQMR